MYERTEIANYPPMAVPIDLENRKGYDLSPGGIIPVKNNERPPQPVTTTLDLNISERTVARKEARLREIFKIDLIRQATATGMSQYEHHSMKYNALKAIQPLVCSLTARTTEALMDRVHTLLKQNDKEYQKLLLELPEDAQGEFHFDNLKEMMRQSKKLADIGRAAQAIQAYGSFNPQAIQKVDSEKAIEQALINSQLPELIKDDAELGQERAAFNQQAQAEQQQAQQMEQQKVAPAMLQAEAQAAKTQDEITRGK